ARCKPPIGHKPKTDLCPARAQRVSFPVAVLPAFPHFEAAGAGPNLTRQEHRRAGEIAPTLRSIRAPVKPTAPAPTGALRTCSFNFLWLGCEHALDTAKGHLCLDTCCRVGGRGRSVPPVACQSGRRQDRDGHGK